MRRITTGIAAMVLISSTVLAVAPAAQATKFNGKFYVYTGYNLTGQCNAFLGDSDGWGAGCMTSPDVPAVSSVLNYGIPQPYDKVRIYWGFYKSGASFCVAQGVAVANLGTRTFNLGPGTTGYGQSADNNAVSHRWVDHSTC